MYKNTIKVKSLITQSSSFTETQVEKTWWCYECQRTLPSEKQLKSHTETYHKVIIINYLFVLTYDCFILVYLYASYSMFATRSY